MKFPPRENGSNGSSEGSTSMYLRIKDGETVTFALRGNMYTFFQKGFGPTTEIVGAGEGGKIRYRHNVIIRDGEKLAAKIFEFGIKIYDQISALEKSGWDLEQTNFTLSRKGSDKENTTYTLTPNPKPITAAGLKELAKIDLHELKHADTMSSPNRPVKNYAPTSDGDSDGLPF